MNTARLLREAARDPRRRALPILSFPAVQLMRAGVRLLMTDSDLMARAMEIVAERTPAAASVSPMDLSVEAEAFGASVRFFDDKIPAVTGRLIPDGEAARRLAVPPVGAARTGVCIQAVRLAKQRVTDRPVLAGCIGPYSLAGRLMDVTEIMYLCFDEPETVRLVLDKATEFLIEYCRALRGAGADGIVLAEPLAGLLSPDMNDEFSCPYVRRIIGELQTGEFAFIYHNCGGAALRQADSLFRLGAAAYHFGNAVSLRAVLEKAPPEALCMGNIDPVRYFADGTPEEMRRAVGALLADCAPYPNFLLSSGCDIPPRARWENIDAFFEAAEAFRPEG